MQTLYWSLVLEQGLKGILSKPGMKYLLGTEMAAVMAFPSTVCFLPLPLLFLELLPLLLVLILPFLAIFRSFRLGGSTNYTLFY